MDRFYPNLFVIHRNWSVKLFAPTKIHFSFQAHSCVEKAGLIAMVKVRQLPVDEHYSLRGQTLDECIQADKKNGLIPFFVRYLSSSYDFN